MDEVEVCNWCGERPPDDGSYYCPPCVEEMVATARDDEKAHVKRLESERKEAIRG